MNTPTLPVPAAEILAPHPLNLAAPMAEQLRAPRVPSEPLALFKALWALGQANRYDVPTRDVVAQSIALCRAALPYGDDDLVDALETVERDGPNARNIAAVRAKAKRGLRLHLGIKSGTEVCQ